MKIWKMLAASLLALGACGRVQAQAQTVTAVQAAEQGLAYRGGVVSTAAANYVHRANSKVVDRVPNTAGRTKTMHKLGVAKITAEYQALQGPTTFGNEYLTYVMWPISPDGRPANLGEVSVDNNGRATRYQPDQTLDLRSPMQEVKTVFATRSRVLVGQFWGGRIQISEIGGTLNMQNVILGPSGSAGLLDYHPPRLNEPNLPRSIAFNGFSVEFQLGRNTGTERRAEIWRCLAWIRGAGRRCRL